jgi:hypothetical protein
MGDSGRAWRRTYLRQATEISHRYMLIRKVSAGHLTYAADGRDSAKSGLGR